MWKAAREREMAIWSRVVAWLEENLRRIRWRIFARKMNRFARACWRYAYRQIVDKRIGARRVHPNDWPDVRGLDVTDLAQPDLAEPDPGKRNLDCMRCRSEDAQRQARAEGRRLTQSHELSA